LNAAILKYAKRTINGFHRAMKTLELGCPLFLTQNDGDFLPAVLESWAFY
jgi:N-methylhydantoinase A/oxoprolinase/acetone carboxylase beta subunit